MAASLDGGAFAGVVNEHLPHGSSRGPEKIVSIGCLLETFPAEQAQEGFVEQGRRLERVTRTLPNHGPMSDASKLLINEFREAIAGLRFSRPNVGKKGGYV